MTFYHLLLSRTVKSAVTRVKCLDRSLDVEECRESAWDINKVASP